MNNSKVLPARLFGTKAETGAKVEFLLIKRLHGDVWESMVKPGKRLKPGDSVIFSDDFKADILDYGEDGTRIVEFKYNGIFMERLEELGKMPLPPYIERESVLSDKDRYQTVYCKEEGSVAAPTAGLHFTEELLEKAKAKGVKLAYVTLHVGIGTFRPVKCENIEDHQMHFEEYEITQENADIINETKAAGGRIISVGTTSTRTMESAAVEKDGKYVMEAGSDSTGIFIYPGYEFKIIDSLITNFHLPKSTLLMLISALYNREDILKVCETAVKEEYRFFSYGDAMIII
jgi:S-adenosylmethionine:tRNA ribosyltransferase-isomerase